MSETINVKISNWLGEVCFETTQSDINEFNEYTEGFFEETLSEENNYTIDSLGMMFEEPYVQLDPIGEFVIVSEYSLMFIQKTIRQLVQNKQLVLLILSI